MDRNESGLNGRTAMIIVLAVIALIVVISCNSYGQMKITLDSNQVTISGKDTTIWKPGTKVLTGWEVKNKNITITEITTKNLNSYSIEVRVFTFTKKESPELLNLKISYYLVTPKTKIFLCDHSCLYGLTKNTSMLIPQKIMLARVGNEIKMVVDTDSSCLYENGTPKKKETKVTQVTPKISFSPVFPNGIAMKITEVIKKGEEREIYLKEVYTSTKKQNK